MRIYYDELKIHAVMDQVHLRIYNLIKQIHATLAVSSICVIPTEVKSQYITIQKYSEVAH
jgi:hypothetical protein